MDAEKTVKVVNKKSHTVKVIGIIGAWLSLTVLGVIMLWFTTLFSVSLVTGEAAQDSGPGMVMLNGLSGMLILAIIILAIWRVRRKPYFFHFLIGLWIGLVTYLCILAAGISMYYVAANNVAANPQATCTNSLEKYQRYSDAVIPIATDLGEGTGIVIDDKGTVLTAHHVVQDTQRVYANYASGEVGMNVVEVAPEYDLALLKLDRFEPSHFSLSSTYSVGDEVLSYGYPGNAYSAGSPSISKGIISRVLTVADLRMTVQETPDGMELVQTDAAINPGNSGGPLIGRCGVVGVVVSMSDSVGLSGYVGAASEQGIGYAVSAKTAAARFKLPIHSEY